jgi:uncharacterized protein YjbI with pentapeptide repeats
LEAEYNLADGCCVLHSENSKKHKTAFDQTLAAHRKQKGDDFAYVIFPAAFKAEAFEGDVSFVHAQFWGSVDFNSTRFSGKVDFSDVWFSGNANFTETQFKGKAIFSKAIFAGNANFSNAQFAGNVNLFGACFARDVTFDEAQFNEGADFEMALFAENVSFMQSHFRGEVSFECTKFRKEASFDEAEFNARTRFCGTAQEGQFYLRLIEILNELEPDQSTDPNSFEIYFQSASIEPLDSVQFINIDLTRWRLLGTDLRKTEFTNVKWPEWRGRSAVHDEVAHSKNEDFPFAHIERLYRDLKQNFEERRDFERASDFHYGEKEMRRKNPDTPLRLKIPLYAYWLMSGYGERYLRSLLSICAVVLLSMVGYLAFGLETPEGAILDWTSRWDRLQAAHYALRVMTLLKPDDLVPVGCSQFVHTADSILGPVLIGLFALALRQRLKR